MLKAQAQVRTDKAPRYLKALCNHFSHKVQATYAENQGTVQFGFGTCEMQANEETLAIQIQAADAEALTRVKWVLADHLERFSGTEALTISWQE